VKIEADSKLMEGYQLKHLDNDMYEGDVVLASVELDGKY